MDCSERRQAHGAAFNGDFLSSYLNSKLNQEWKGKAIASRAAAPVIRHR
jgi:hypothetical protein